jgi:hypothetical protein
VCVCERERDRERETERERDRERKRERERSEKRKRSVATSFLGSCTDPVGRICYNAVEKILNDRLLTMTRDEQMRGREGRMGRVWDHTAPFKEMDIHSNRLWDRQIVPPAWR